MITEDYVSFEVAKLLKEKGFGEYTLGFYKDNEKKLDFDRFADDWNTKHVGYIAAPTHQMALKWLREIYHCHVTIEYVFKADAKLTNDYASYCFSVENANTFIEFVQDEWYNTYEEACEAAIKYCLENLI